MYVSVKGGEKAIVAAHTLLDKARRGDLLINALSVEQIVSQMRLAVHRVMNEASLYDEVLAALAIKQSSGDLVEAIFLLRAYRTTLARVAVASPIETESMQVQRRISAIFKDVPGGQILGATYDYTHRLLNFALLAEQDDTEEALPNLYASELDEVLKETAIRLADKSTQVLNERENLTSVIEVLTKMELIERELTHGNKPFDITREAVSYPCDRSARLQQLVRADEGFLLSLAYSTQRGYGRNHPFAGEIKIGDVEVIITPDELGFEVVVGEILLSECQMVTGIKAEGDHMPYFTRGYGLVFGESERKAMSMAVIDRALQTRENNESILSPAQDEEFVLAHADNVDAAGFLSHLKLPHYVDFQAELILLRQLQAEYRETHKHLNSEGKDQNE